jgi:hypothetical protein
MDVTDLTHTTATLVQLMHGLIHTDTALVTLDSQVSHVVSILVTVIQNVQPAWVQAQINVFSVSHMPSETPLGNVNALMTGEVKIAVSIKASAMNYVMSV